MSKTLIEELQDLAAALYRYGGKGGRLVVGRAVYHQCFKEVSERMLFNVKQHKNPMEHYGEPIVFTMPAGGLSVEWDQSDCERVHHSGDGDAD